MEGFTVGTNKNTCKSAHVMSLLGKGPAAGHVQTVPAPQVRDIETITAEILNAKRAGGEAILAIGRGLMEAKAMMSHGEWLPWLTEQVEFSESTAQRFMRLAKEWSNPSALTDLGATKALQLLALPESERTAFLAESHQVGGEEKTVIDMTSRELDRAIKERDEALRSAEQARAEQSAAQQARTKMAEDMALANERIAGLNAEMDARAAEGVKWQKEIARLEIELSELKSRPVEVAVQVDEKAVEAARKEAEAAMQAKLDEAQKAQARAEEARKAAEGARAAAQAEAQAVRTELARVEKNAALTSNEDLVLFKELFDRAQEQINRIHGLLLRARGKDADRAEKMSRALLALSDKIREAVGACGAEGQLAICGWMPGGTQPFQPCDVVADFDLAGTGRISRMACRFDGGCFRYEKSRDAIRSEAVRWMALPPVVSESDTEEGGKG